MSLYYPEHRVVPGLHQESVWDYPLRPLATPSERHIKVIFGGVTVAETRRSIRVVQRGIPPTYYFPFEDVRADLLEPGGHSSFCEHKGHAEYFHVRVGERTAKNAAWRYLDSPDEATPSGLVAFYAHLLDTCTVDAQVAHAPEWAWLGGWVTPEVVGPFVTREEAETLWHD